MKLLILKFLTVFFSTLPVQALDVDPVFTFGAETGGETLNQIPGKNLNHSIRAGSGMTFAAGLSLPISKTKPHAFEARLTLGLNYWFDGGNEENGEGSTTWFGLPIELQYFYHNKRNLFRVGYGLTYRFNNSVSTKGTSPNHDIRFKDSLGFNIAVEKFIEDTSGSSIGGFGLKYSKIQYVEVSSGYTIPGDSIGIYMIMLIADG